MDVFRELIDSEQNRVALHEYTVVDFLGKGGFAVVFLAERKFDGKQVAVKVYSKADRKASKARAESLRKEADLFRMLKSPHVLTYIDFKETATHIFIVLEYCNGGDVWKFLEKRRNAPAGKQLAPAEVAGIVRLLVKALLYLHEKKLIHRDIKPGTRSSPRKRPDPDRRRTQRDQRQAR